MAHDFRQGTQTWGATATSAGEEVVESISTTVVDKRAPRPPFLYKWHPNRWAVIDGEWLPVLGQLRVEAGVANVDRTGNTAPAEADAARRGWRVIPNEIIEGGYLRRHRCARGYFYTSRWEQPRHQNGKPVRSRIDREGYKAFLRYLVASGVVAPPDDDILDMMTDKQRRRVNALLGDESAKGKHKLAKEQKRLAEMETAEIAQPAKAEAPPVKGEDEAPAPAPKKRTTRRKSSTASKGGASKKADT